MAVVLPGNPLDRDVPSIAASRSSLVLTTIACAATQYAQQRRQATLALHRNSKSPSQFTLCGLPCIFWIPCVTQYLVSSTRMTTSEVPGIFTTGWSLPSLFNFFLLIFVSLTVIYTILNAHSLFLPSYLGSFRPCASCIEMNMTPTLLQIRHSFGTMFTTSETQSESLFMT